ncbi:MAG: hypothetical protein AAF998_13150 [Bacteroidota bacterium]
MKNFVFRFLGLCFLLLWAACAPPETDNAPATGNRATDNAPQDGPAIGGKAHAYSPEANLLDPNHIDFLRDCARHQPHPFNAPFIRQRNLGQIRFNQYSNAENELTAEAQEGSLQLTGRRIFEFDREGKLMVFETEALGDLETLTKITVGNEYDFHRALSKQTVQEQIGEKLTSTEVKFGFDEQDRLITRRDSLGISIFYRYDDGREHRYEMSVTPAGVVAVKVFGQPGDFPDDEALLLQDQILTLGSEFIPYDQAPALVGQIDLYEMQERQIVRQVDLGPNGVIEGIVNRQYNGFENPIEESYLWDQPEALFRYQKVFRYNPGNDLVKSITKRARHQDETTTQVVTFSYGPEGLLEKVIHSVRKDNGPEVIEAIDFVSYQMRDTQPQPGAAIPGGTGG